MFESLKSKLSGCFYTIFTPFNEAYNIDYETLENYLVHLYNGGARRFYAMAYNSRYSQMTFEEIAQFNEYCITFLKGLDANNIVVVGDPIHCSTKISTEFALKAKNDGADLISLIMREKYFSDDQVLEHFNEIGEKVKFPILIHEMPFLSGYDGNNMHWPVSLLRSLPKNPYIVALKEDAKNYEITKMALELEPTIKIIIAGTKSSFIRYKKFGADAYLNGISIIDARIGELFWQAYKNNDTNVIKDILEKMEAPFFEGPVQKYGWHRCNKALLQCANLMNRRDRMPLKELSEIEFSEVKVAYEQIQLSIAKRFET